MCTPTRYALLTGRYPWRTRLPRGVLWGNGDALIEPGRMTMASLLRDAGYHTAGIGKWHLGLRWAAAAGSTPDRTTNTETAPVDWIDYARRIADGPTHHGFAEFFGLAGLARHARLRLHRRRPRPRAADHHARRRASVRSGLLPSGPGGRIVPVPSACSAI